MKPSTAIYLWFAVALLAPLPRVSKASWLSEAVTRPRDLPNDVLRHHPTQSTVVSGHFTTESGKTSFVTDKGAIVPVASASPSASPAPRASAAPSPAASATPQGTPEVSPTVAKTNAAVSAFDANAVVGKTADGKVQVRDAQFKLLSSLDKAAAQVPNGAAKTELKTSIDDLRSKVSDVVADGTAETAKEAANSITTTQEALASAYLSLNQRQQPDAVRKLGTAYFDTVRSKKRLNKAIYQYDDQYAPETYRAIYDQCKSVARLVQGTGRNRLPIGTSFLVAKNIVATASHCLRDRYDEDIAPQSLHFEFETIAEDGSHRQSSFPAARVVVNGFKDFTNVPIDQRLDFALVELGTDGSGKTPDAAGFKPLQICKETDQVKRERAVYVVGYPNGGEKTVADYARVFVPYEASDKMHAGFELEIGGQITNAEERARQDPDQASRDLQLRICQKNAEVLRQLFIASFKPITRNNDKWWLFVSAFLADKDNPPQPAIALDSDTFHGDSGSPVFLRGSSEVIGVLIRGAPDVQDLKVSWTDHEEAIPIQCVMDAWNTLRPGESATFLGATNP